MAGELVQTSSFGRVRGFPQMRISLMSGPKFHLQSSGETFGSLQFTWRTGLILAVPRASFGGLPLGALSPLSIRGGRIE